MTVERIDIQIREDGSRVVKRGIQSIGGEAVTAANSVDLLKRALLGLSAGLLARELIQLADAYTNLQNRLRATGLEGTALASVMNALKDVSNETRSSFEGSVELYSRLAISSKELGVSQQQLIDFTKSLNQAIILSGASATEAQAGLIQLSQGMASGTLRGDELRSVLEQLPAVADVIAKSMGVTRGQLRALGEDGKITAQTILTAFQKARTELDQNFAKTVPTLSQSLQVLRNNFLDFIGRSDQALGITKFLSSAILTLSKNIDTVAMSVVAFVSGFALVGGTILIVRGLTSAFLALAAAMAANPVGAFLVVLTSAVTAITLFRDRILLGSDSVTTLGDYLRALGERVASVFSGIAEFARSTFGPLIDIVRKWAGEVDISIIGVLRFVARGVDTYVGLWTGATAVVIRLFETLAPTIEDLLTQALNVILTKIGAFVNKAGELLNSVSEFAGLGKIIENSFDLTLTNKQEGQAKNFGKGLGEAFSQGFESQNSAVKFIDGLESRAKEIGAKRRAGESALPSPSTIAGPASKLIDEKEIKKLQDALRHLLDTILPVQGAQLEMAKGQKLLDEALAKGVIPNTELYAQYVEALGRHYKDLIDPLGKINRDLDKETQLLELNSTERQVQAQALQIIEDLQKQGINLTEKEINQLGAKLVALQQLNAVVAEQDRILADSVGKRKQFADQLVALQNLLNDPNSGLTKGDAAQALVGTNPELFAGTNVALEAQAAKYQDMYSQIDQMRAKDLISAQTAEQLKAKATSMYVEDNLQNMQGFFGNLATLSRSGNRKLALIGKAAAISQATIDGILGVQKALSAAPPPINFALAAAVGIAAASNVAQIASQGPGFEAGGFTGTMPRGQVAGVVHGQEFVLNAAATARHRQDLERMNRGQEPIDVGAGGKRGKVSNQTNNISISVPAGTDRASAQQMGASIARQLQRSSSRNN